MMTLPSVAIVLPAEQLQKEAVLLDTVSNKIIQNIKFKYEFLVHVPLPFLSILYILYCHTLIPASIIPSLILYSPLPIFLSLSPNPISLFPIPYLPIPYFLSPYPLLISIARKHSGIKL